MASGQIHIAILNPGVEITPLRLRGWLQKEAAVINNRANPGDGAILRLFLTKQLRYGLPGKKLDAMLQALTEKYLAVLLKGSASNSIASRIRCLQSAPNSAARRTPRVR